MFDRRLQEWTNLAFCLGQLGFTEKGLRCAMELYKHYKHALGLEPVYAAIQVCMQCTLKHVNSRACP